MGLLFMIAWIGFVIFMMRKHKSLIYNPMMWLFAGWFFCFGLYCVSGIDYNYKLSLNSGIYYWAVAICVYIGFRISKKYRLIISKDKPRKHFPKINKIGGKSYVFYTIMTCAGCVVYVFDIIRLNVISFNLHSSLNMSGLGHIGLIMCCMGLNLWLYECMSAISENRKFRISAFASMLCYLVPALLTSGRQSILIFAVSTFVVLFYSFSRVKEYRYSIYLKAPIILAGIGLFIYITIISASRTNVSNKVDLFNYIYQSSLSESANNMLDKLGVFKVFIMEILYYYSHELSMLEILLSKYDGPLFWGMSQMQLLSRNISVSGSMTVFDEMWKHLDAVSAEAGVYSHVWRSAAGNCFLDFGIVGGLVFAAVCGYIIGRFHLGYNRKKTPYGTVGMALVCAGMLFAMQFSPICENYWLYPFLWWLVLPIVEGLARRGKNPIRNIER